MKSASNFVFWRAIVLAACFACNSPTSAASADPHANPDSTRCADCHTPEFNAVTHPPHPNARPTSCGVCHTQTSWKPWRVDHPGYELTGAHLKAAQDEALAGNENQVKCFWCHHGDPSTFKNTKKECIACHAPDRETSTFPGHATFATTCQDCHSTDAWKPAKKPVIAQPEEPATTKDAGPPAHATTPHATTKLKPKVTPTPVPTPLPTATIPAPDVTSKASRRH